MPYFYKTISKAISTVIIQMNLFYGCLKASSNSYLLFTVYSLDSNGDICRLRSYTSKRLLKTDCLGLIQSTTVIGDLSTQRYTAVTVLFNAGVL